MTSERTSGEPHSALPAPTYGIHILKAWMIFFQILAHAHLWAVQSNSYFTDPQLTPFGIKVAMSFGCFGMVVPMTAGAVLRMICATDKDGRVVNIDWRSMITTMGLLALFESTKDAAVYDLSAFFLWSVLHLIAIAFLLTLFIAQYGMKWLWCAALTVLFITPFMIDILDPWETSLTRGLNSPDWPLEGIVFAGILTFLALIAAVRLKGSRSFAPKHKRRMSLLLGAAWVLAVYGCLHLKNGIMTISALKTIGVGPLVGTHSGLHIWGFFPWGGTIMLGFLIYDVILRTKAKPAVMLAILASGIALLSVFFYFYAPQADAVLSVYKKSVLSGIYLNRMPAMAMLITGLFCVMAPVAYVLMRMGLEKGYIVGLSRCILWVYIYQTSLLVILPPYFTRWLPHDEGMLAYTLFALVTSLALPLILQRLPFKLHLQLKKRSADV